MSPIPSAEWPFLTTCLYRPWSRKEVDRLSCLHFLMPKQGWRGRWGEGIVARKNCFFFFFFVLTNVRYPHVCVFGHVLLELAWRRTALLTLVALSLTYREHTCKKNRAFEPYPKGVLSRKH